MVTEEQIREYLSEYRDPFLKEDLVDAKVLKNIEIKGDIVHISLKLGFPLGEYQSRLKEELGEFLSNKEPTVNFELDISWRVDAHVHPAKVQAMPNVKNIIAVASGKGGVGKSTTSVNLALGLKALGANVGILDADIYGPSMPIMLGMQGKNPETIDKKSILPIESHGLQSMSIGYLVKPEQAMVWRGPMASGALQKPFNDT